MSERHTESELRGMITARQNEIEEIMYRCERSGFPQAAEELQDAMVDLTAAKHALVREAKAREVQGE